MRLIAAVLLCLSAAPAFAADNALDLSLPKSGSPWGQPYDGSMARVADGSATATRDGCPTAADGSPSALTGSVTTGFVYSSRMGSGSFSAARLNYCKSYTADDGDQGTFNLQVQVGTRDGFDDWRRGHGRGAPPPRGGRGGF